MKLPNDLVNYFDTIHEGNIQVAMRRLEGDFSSDGDDRFGSNGGTYNLIIDCFLDNDSVLFESAMPWLREQLQGVGFMDSILRIERNRLQGELERLNIDPVGASWEIESKKEELDELCADTLYRKAVRSFEDFCSTLVAAKDFTERQCIENFFLTKLLCIVYEAHQSEQREQNRYLRTPQKSTRLYQYYQAADVNLLESDAQYSKYNLYSVTADTELLIGFPNRILDPEHSVQLFIESTPIHVLELFNRLRHEGLIKELALLASAGVIIETEQRIFFEFGYEVVRLPLTLKNLSQQADGQVVHTVLRKSCLTVDENAIPPSVSTFSRPGSDDRTWCSITDNSMTFEEIAHVPELLEDCAVTRMVHLEYFIDSGRLYVSHIDHEFIFYTHAEFDLRAHDPLQKGNARKRLKTFKIDRSSIPFMLDDGTLFVHTLIDAFFEKPDLLMEFLLGLLKRG